MYKENTHRNALNVMFLQTCITIKTGVLPYHNVPVVVPLSVSSHGLERPRAKIAEEAPEDEGGSFHTALAKSLWSGSVPT